MRLFTLPRRFGLCMFAMFVAMFLASDANAGFLKRLKERRNGCQSGCQTASGACGDNCASATSTGCAGCNTVANLNGVGVPTTGSLVTIAGKQYTQSCVNGVCKLTEYVSTPAPDNLSIQPKSASGPESIVIDGKSYLLVPIPRAKQ